ncbi:hypothetical protein GYB22_02590 [bacterium]|nr:hypothetical protein [bacterium]
MKKINLLLLLVVACLAGKAQNPIFSAEKLSLIGLHQLNDGSILLLSQENGDVLDLNLLNAQMESQWTNTFEVPNLGGHHFNRLQIHSNAAEIFIVSQLDHSVFVDVYDISTGNTSYKHLKVPIEVQPNAPEVQCFSTSKGLYLVYKDELELKYSHLINGEFDILKPFLEIEEKYNESYLKAEFSHDNKIYSSSYTLSRDHEKMHLFLNAYDIAADTGLSKEIDLELDQMSFTYNSMYDLNLTGTKKVSNGFFLYGKLDMKLGNEYPRSRTSEGFVGIWLAYFDFNLNLVYFHQYPFQNMKGLVKQNAVTQAAVIDLKEDINGNTFLVINEVQEITHGLKYVFYIDQKGEILSMIGGQDMYNFFEYDRLGLRDAGRNNRVRLMNDDWSPYLANSFHVMNYIENLHSRVINNIQYLANESNLLAEKMAYTYLVNKQGDVVVLEYIDKKRGTLKIYPFSN